MRKLFIVIIVFVSCVACNKASAPPVDLPAPVTGRVDVGPTDVSSPDEDGNVQIAGGADSAPAGAVVMAVNETVAGSAASWFFHLPISSAHASGPFPAVCYDVGHACTRANSDGSFSLSIAGGEEDSIAIGIIDEDDGEFISPVSRIEVPRVGEERRANRNSGSDGLAAADNEEASRGRGQGRGSSDSDAVDDNSTRGRALGLGNGETPNSNPSSDGNPPRPDPQPVNPPSGGGVSCPPGLVTGKIVDLAIMPDTRMPILLREGSSTSGNALVVGSAGVNVPIEGCHAHSMAVGQSANGTIVVVTSKNDKKIWKGRVGDNGNVTDARTFNIDYEPMHIALDMSGEYAVAAVIGVGNLVNLARIHLSDGSISLAPVAPAEGNSLRGKIFSTDFDVLTMQDGRQRLGLVVLQGPSPADSYLVLFNAAAATPQVLRVFDMPRELSIAGGARLARFFTLPVANSEAQSVNIAVADDADSEIQSWEILKGDLSPFTTSSNIAELATPKFGHPRSAKICVTECDGRKIVSLGVSQIARRMSGAGQAVFIVPLNNATIAAVNPGDSGSPQISHITAGTHLFGRIAVSDGSKKIAVLDFGVSSGFVDATQLVAWE